MSKRQKVAHPKAQITFRQHFLPVLLGFLMFGSVLGALNSQWLVAQAEYRFAPKASASSIIPATSVKAPADSLDLNIASINVDAPVVYESSMTEWKLQLALRDGVVHLGPTALPGQPGNVVIVGHSSQVPWAPGNYKFVFTLLDKVKKGDLVTIDYKGTRYMYRVYGSKVVEPTDFSVIQPTRQQELTLITCTPVGTSKQRLVIHAKQVSPKPITSPETTLKDVTSLKQLPQ